MISADNLLRWLFAFSFTQLVEIPIYRRGLRTSSLKAFGASAITHPVVWFLIPSVWSALYRWSAPLLFEFTLSREAQHWGYGVLAEGFAVAVEAAYFAALGAKKPFRWALFANAASALSGLLWSRLFGWP